MHNIEPGQLKIRYLDWLPSALLIILLAVATLTQLFVDPGVGLANNGDYGRLLYQLGLAFPASATSGEQRFDYINLIYQIKSERDVFSVGYLTSERALLEPALIVNAP